MSSKVSPYSFKLVQALVNNPTEEHKQIVILRIGQLEKKIRMLERKQKNQMRRR